MSYLAGHAGVPEQARSSAAETVPTSSAAADRLMSGKSALSRSAAFTRSVSGYVADSFWHCMQGLHTHPQAIFVVNLVSSAKC